MQGHFCITGTPGTGKKTLSPLVAAVLGVPCRGLNDLATRHGLVERGTEGRVDTAELRRLLSREYREPALFFGHLVPYVLRRDDVAKAVVLRCEPRVLGARLTSRGYERAKTLENVEAELIGVVSADTVGAFGLSRVAEFDTSACSPQKAAEAVARLLSDSGARTRPIDWMGSYESAKELKSLLSPYEGPSGFT